MERNKLLVTQVSDVTYRDGMFDVPVRIGIERGGRIVRWEDRTLKLSEYQVTSLVKGATRSLRSTVACLNNRLERLKEAAA